MWKYAALGTALMMGGLSGAQAATIQILTDPGIAMETANGIRTDTSTRGVDLAGMEVTVTYGDNSSEVLTWTAYDPYTNGGASSSDLSISMGYAGFDVVASKLVKTMSFKAAMANSIFDISTAEEGQTGNTPTTYVGFPLRFNAGENLLEGVVSATYSNIVNVIGRAADGDAFTDLLVDFSAVQAGGLLGTVNFETDMDTLAVAGDLAPATIPVPASLPMLMAGVGGLVLLERRRAKG